MSDRGMARVVASLAFVYLVLTAIGVVLSWQNGDLGYLIQVAVGVTALAIVGGILVLRRPRNPIGWLFVGAGFAAALGNACIGLAEYGALTAPGSIPLSPIAAWLVTWLAGAILMQLAFSIFLFPTGSLPSRRWRPVAFGVGLVGLAITAIWSFGAPELGSTQVKIANPFLVPALRPVASVITGSFFFFLLALAVASLVARYRAAPGAERQQLKWIVLAAVLMVVFFWGASIGSPLSFASGFLAFLILPTAVAIAILRYRLFDIDHLINRTLVYGATSGVIAVLFFAPVVGLQPLLRPLTSGSELAVAASTLVAFALFQPIRRRIQEAVDRRFDRSRYDAARTLDAFSDELRDEVDLERVEADLLTAVSATMAPQHISLWLRRGMPGMGSNTVTISGRPVVRKELA